MRNVCFWMSETLNFHLLKAPITSPNGLYLSPKCVCEVLHNDSLYNLDLSKHMTAFDNFCFWMAVTIILSNCFFWIFSHILIVNFNMAFWNINCLELRNNSGCGYILLRRNISSSVYLQLGHYCPVREIWDSLSHEECLSQETAKK